jgi:integral membrane protein (TIGR01906 family)
VFQQALRVWYASLLALLVLGLWAWSERLVAAVLAGLSRGGWLTVIFVAVVIPLVLVAFGVFFVAFHEVFFDPGTWTFLFSDTLIRLFPERFWRDTFLALALLSLAGGLALGLGLREKSVFTHSGS